MTDNGIVDQFFMQWQTINRYLRKGMLLEGEERIMRIQWMFLRYIRRSDDCTMGHIAEKFGVKPSTVSQTMDRLEKHGLVERVSGKEDARQKIVRLTEKGQSLIHSVESIWSMRLSKSLSQFTDMEQAELIELLSKLAAAMRDMQQNEDHESNPQL